MIKDRSNENKKVCFSQDDNCYTVNGDMPVEHFYLCTGNDKVTPMYELTSPFNALRTRANPNKVYPVGTIPYHISMLDVLKNFNEYNIRCQYDTTTKSLYWIVAGMIINDYDCLELNLLHDTPNIKRTTKTKLFIHDSSFFEVALNKADTIIRLKEIKDGNYINAEKTLKFLLKNQFIKINIDDNAL